MKETDFQGRVIDLARIYGWLVAHFRPARTEHGWVTPVSADGAGFPDLIFFKGQKMVVAELKIKPNKLSSRQSAWLIAFAAVTKDVFVWYPEDWDEIEKVLTK